FEKRLLDLRDKRVLHLDDTAEVRRVEVTGASPAYTLEKDGFSWKLLAPQQDAADAAVSDRVANSLKSLRATAIATESADGAALKQYGLSPAKRRVQVTVAAAGGKDAHRGRRLPGRDVHPAGAEAGPREEVEGVQRAVLDYRPARGGVRRQAGFEGLRGCPDHLPAGRRRQGPRQAPDRRSDQGRQAALCLLIRPAPRRRSRERDRRRSPQVPRRPPRT